MKTQKLIVISAIVCLLVGASGVAMAEPSDCSLGYIANETVEGITVNTGGNCLISDVLVLGDISIRNGLDVVIRNTRVFGSVRIQDSLNVGLYDSEVVNGDVKVIRPITAYIVGNTLLRSGPQRRLVVRGVGVNAEDGVGEALIFDNREEAGTIQCRANNGQAFARSNIALSVTCPGQINE